MGIEKRVARAGCDCGRPQIPIIRQGEQFHQRSPSDPVAKSGSRRILHREEGMCHVGVAQVFSRLRPPRDSFW